MPMLNSIWFYLVLIVVLLAMLVALIVFGFGRASQDGRIRDVAVGVPRKPSTRDRDPASQEGRSDAYSGAGLRQDSDHDPA